MNPGNKVTPVARCQLLEERPSCAIPLQRCSDVSRQAVLSSTQRLRLMADHLLVGFRGVNLRAYRSSSRRLIRLSIQPKHSASPTASSHAMHLTAVWSL